jgi:hypothetical protein
VNQEAKPKPRGSGGFKSSRGATFGTLEQVFEDVWWSWGTVKFGPGVLFPRNMMIVREGDGLVIVHPVMMPPAVQAQVEALGPIKHIVRLGAFHGMDDALYVKRYAPTVWAPPGVEHRDGVSNVRELVAQGEQPFRDGQVFAFTRSLTPEVCLLLARHGGVLLTCDSVQNWENTRGCSLLGGLMARAMGFRGRACIGPGWRKMSEPKDGGGFASEFERLLGLEFRHVLSGHGAPMRDDAKQVLRERVRGVYGAA